MGGKLEYLIPGLENFINIPFAARKLPVCATCKQDYKSRERCRLEHGHTDIPWNTIYLCVTLDDSCFTRDLQGRLCLVNEGSMRFVAQSIPEPSLRYRAKEGHIDGKYPFCMACKEKDYTRYHCRGMQHHRQLPWETSYISLSATPLIPGDRRYFPEEDDNNLDVGSKRPASDTVNGVYELSSKKVKANKCIATSSSVETSDDIHKIEYSRTFLLKIKNDGSCVLRWLEIDSLVRKSEPISWEY